MSGAGWLAQPFQTVAYSLITEANMAKRSSFTRMPVIHQMHVFESVNFQSSPKLTEWIHSVTVGIGQSQISEDGAQRSVKLGVKGQTQVTSWDRRWYNLVKTHYLRGASLRRRRVSGQAQAAQNGRSAGSVSASCQGHYGSQEHTSHRGQHVVSAVEFPQGRVSMCASVRFARHGLVSVFLFRAA